ncbi:MAG: hypothetical protein JWO80_2027, partial [Bryobacterales bacterium]|nr:hypothetical protein [Bryobacterales bacterium]
MIPSSERKRSVRICVYPIALFVVGFSWGVAKGAPIPFSIDVTGQINGTPLTFGGPGVIDPIGFYNASLTFSDLPTGFQPVAVTAYTLSICSFARPETFHGAISLSMLLDHPMTYSSTRVLTFPSGETVTISGTVTEDSLGDIAFAGTVNGFVHLPSDVTGAGAYQTVLTPNGPGQILESGSGQI